MTYAELQAAIIAETLRSDLAAQVPQFIRRAEAMIARELRAVEMIAQIVLTDADRVAAESGIYNLPSNFLEDRSFIAASRVLRKLSMAGLIEYRGSGPVYVYALRNDAVNGKQVEFRGVPAAAAEIDVEYFARPAALAADADTNTLLETHESVYYHAALFALYSFTQDLELAESAHTIWLDSVSTLNEQAGRYLGGASARPNYNLGHRAIGRGY